MRIFSLNSTTLADDISAQLIAIIRNYRTQTGKTDIWAWLYVHCWEEGASVELALGSLADVGSDFWVEGEIFDYLSEDSEAPQIEIDGLADWYQQWSADWQTAPILEYKDWQICVVGEFDLQSVGFTADELENTFIQRIYRDILQATTRRYPDDIAGFVLEMHDTALAKEWITFKDTTL